MSASRDVSCMLIYATRIEPIGFDGMAAEISFDFAVIEKDFDTVA